MASSFDNWFDYYEYNDSAATFNTPEGYRAYVVWIEIRLFLFLYCVTGLEDRSCWFSDSNFLIDSESAYTDDFISQCLDDSNDDLDTTDSNSDGIYDWIEDGFLLIMMVLNLFQS